MNRKTLRLIKWIYTIYSAGEFEGTRANTTSREYFLMRAKFERTISTGDLGVDVARARFSISLFDMASWAQGGQDVSWGSVKLERRKLKRNASNPLESVNPPATASYRMQGTWTDRSGRTFECWIQLSLWRYTFPYERGNRLNSAKVFVALTVTLSLFYVRALRCK